MEEVCPKTAKCPLFNDGLLKRQQSAETYKSIYCNRSDRYRDCKRFIVAEKFGKCPPFVLPNSSYTIEEIEERMKQENFI